MERLWLMNTHHQTVEIPMMDINPPRIQAFKPNRPVPFERSIALRYMNRFRTIKIVDPAPYFNNRKFQKLMIRDMGLGDMILLEPVLRGMAMQGQEITLMTAFPQIFEGNPFISKVFHMKERRIAEYDRSEFDDVVNLMGVAERHDARARAHRTDIFAMAAEIEINEKEPRLYRKIGGPMFQKQVGKKYIGLEFDATENYRRFPDPLARQLIDYIITQDPNNVVVILGRRAYIQAVNHRNVIDLQGKTTLSQCMDTIANLDAMIACDSGLLHVALSYHIPTVAWFSKITPDYRMRYYRGPKELVVANLPCRPCGDSNDGGCRHGDASDDPDYRIPKFIAPCAKIDPREFYSKLLSLPNCEGPMVYSEVKETVGVG